MFARLKIVCFVHLKFGNAPFFTFVDVSLDSLFYNPSAYFTQTVLNYQIEPFLGFHDESQLFVKLIINQLSWTWKYLFSDFAFFGRR